MAALAGCLPTVQRPPSIGLLSSVLSVIHLAALRLPALFRGFERTDPEELRYPATVFVWVRWFLLAACVIELVYRPLYTPFTYTAYILCLTFLTGFNGLRPLPRPLRPHGDMALDAGPQRDGRGRDYGGHGGRRRVQPLLLLLAVLPGLGPGSPCFSVPSS